MLGVPLERPASLGNRATLGDEELAQLPAQRRITNANDAFFGESRDHWREYGKPQRQTSLIVDPLNGRLPPMTPDGAQRSASLPNEARGPLNGPEDVSRISIPTCGRPSRGMTRASPIISLRMTMTPGACTISLPLEVADRHHRSEHAA